MSESKQDIDAHSGIETTGHEWDGIKELNNPLPRWWLITWYISIAWAIGYMIFMPSIPALPGMGTNTRGIGEHSDRVNVAQAVEDMRAARAAQGTQLLGASLEEIKTDRDLQQLALAMSESVFGDNCATCHGSGGRGAKGYPILADNIWLWDGSLAGIEQTIRHGIRHMADDETRNSQMPAFGRDKFLTSEQIDDLVEKVLSFSGREGVDSKAAMRAEPLWAQHCVSCHGVDGRGSHEVGAANLTDQDWLHGGNRRDIYNMIYNAPNAHMPAWDDRLDDATIKALAVYVNSLSGGE